MDVVIRKKTIEGIPALELIAETAGKIPLVVMVHGYLGQKDFMLNQAYFLASQGFAVVVPDAWGHGDRNPGAVPDFFEAVERTAGDIGTLIRAYRDDPRVDAGRAGITGYSMGGCITYEYISRLGRRVRAAVPFIATPDWVSLMSAPGTAQEFARNGLAGPDGMAPFIEAARRVQPLNRLENIVGVPLLMLNGAEDPLMPVDELRAFFGRIRPLYADPAAVELDVVAGVGHNDTVQMNMRMADWFRRWL